MRTLESNKQYVIDTTKPWHVAWWAAELGVSADELRAAVDLVGNRARMVALHLRMIRETPRRRRTRSSRDAEQTTEV